MDANYSLRDSKREQLFHPEISSSLRGGLQCPPRTNGAAGSQRWRTAPGKRQQNTSSYLVKIQNKTNTAEGQAVRHCLSTVLARPSLSGFLLSVPASMAGKTQGGSLASAQCISYGLHAQAHCNVQPSAVPSTFLVTIWGWKDDLGSFLGEERHALTHLPRTI